MDLAFFDGKCVRIITTFGEVFEGVVTYDNKEYCFHEYGREQEALHMVPILFFDNDIASVISLEDVSGPFGHYSEKYGLLERKCMEWGTDMMEEVFDSEDDIQKLRLLACMNDHFQSLTDRAVPGMALWRNGGIIEDTEVDNEVGPVYLGELEKMLETLVKYNEDEKVVKEAKDLLQRLAVNHS